MLDALFVLLVNVPCRVINQFAVIKKNSFSLCFLSKDNITYKILSTKTMWTKSQIRRKGGANWVYLNNDDVLPLLLYRDMRRSLIAKT